MQLPNLYIMIDTHLEGSVVGYQDHRLYNKSHIKGTQHKFHIGKSSRIQKSVGIFCNSPHLHCPCSRVDLRFGSNHLSCEQRVDTLDLDRKSTRLNSSHVAISYAVFCLKNKTR